MEFESPSLISRYQAVLDELGDNEPSSPLEARAVLDRIRADKGYLDNETMEHMNLMPARSRQNVMRLIDAKKEMEAAYTTR